jgi:hypothetical protein
MQIPLFCRIPVLWVRMLCCWLSALKEHIALIFMGAWTSECNTFLWNTENHITGDAALYRRKQNCKLQWCGNLNTCPSTPMKHKWSPTNKMLWRHQRQECAFVAIYYHIQCIEKQFCLKVLSHRSQMKVGCGDVHVCMCIVLCGAWFWEFGGGIFTCMGFEGDSSVMLTQGKKNYCYWMCMKALFGINVSFIDEIFCVHCEVTTTFNTVSSFRCIRLSLWYQFTRTSEFIGDPDCMECICTDVCNY